MSLFARNLIATLGGTVKVAELVQTPATTVSAWKRIGISDTRLHHIRLAAEAEGIEVDWETGLKPGETQAERDAAPQPAQAA